MMSPRPPLIRHLVVDFDQTLTLKDTLSTLVTASPCDDASEIFERHLTKAYIEDYQFHVKAYPPRNSIRSEFAFLSSLRSIERKSIERVEASNIFKGISPSAISRAAKKVQVRKPSEFTTLVSEVFSHPAGKVTVLSVNWSASFIRQVLNSINSDEGHSSHSESLTVPDLSKVEIIANNLVTDGQGFTTGKIDRRFHSHHNKDFDNGVDCGDIEEHGIWTADDKLRILDQILETEGPSSVGRNTTGARDVGRETETLDTAVDRAKERANEPKSPTRHPTDNAIMAGYLGQAERDSGLAGYNVYVGDSPTDFAALLLCEKMHVGFIMGGEGENKSLLDACKRTGVRVLNRNIFNDQCGDADKCDAEGPAETDRKGILRNGDGDLRALYRVKGWQEIMECLQHPEQWH